MHINTLRWWKNSFLVIAKWILIECKQVDGTAYIYRKSGIIHCIIHIHIHNVVSHYKIVLNCHCMNKWRRWRWWWVMVIAKAYSGRGLVINFFQFGNAFCKKNSLYFPKKSSKHPPRKISDYVLALGRIQKFVCMEGKI